MSATASSQAIAIDAFLIEPPLGSVTLEISAATVDMRFPDGDLESFPRAAVRALDRDDFSVTVHWAGTPVVMSFSTLSASAQIFNELGGFTDDRTFTFLVDESDLIARKLGLEPRAAEEAGRDARAGRLRRRRRS
jgi:hypothetical protein